MKEKVSKVGRSQETENLIRKMGGGHFLERQGKWCFLRKECGLGDSSCPGRLQGMLGAELGEGQMEVPPGHGGGGTPGPGSCWAKAR